MGTVESGKNVKMSQRKMRMGEDGVMSWRLDGGSLWDTCWELFDEIDKIEARQEIRRTVLEARKKDVVESEKNVKERLRTMGMGEDEVMSWRLGGGDLWWSYWELFDESE
jgi:hypothetical protein